MSCTCCHDCRVRCSNESSASPAVFAVLWGLICHQRPTFHNGSNLCGPVQPARTPEASQVCVFPYQNRAAIPQAPRLPFKLYAFSNEGFSFPFPSCVDNLLKPCLWKTNQTRTCTFLSELLKGPSWRFFFFFEREWKVYKTSQRERSIILGAFKIRW